uniref:Inward rectifier potassium channel C-terminal domain-containing protein n=1 Tax=Chlamydomonas euryale TaxID=1486919 RepID=A0A7R9Z2D0_9CHLO|mmetsp:Transcript_40346/g.120328  ORF Transcript_40346/g.120328 Transcript_40346/m.120328 type:complete len:568 (+) Transcript_40346:224-1927(+)
MERVNTHDGGVEMDSLRQTDIESDATTPRNHIGPGQRLMRFSKKSVKQLKKMKIPFKAPSLINKSQPYFSGVTRFGVAGFWNLVNDPFHTLLNLSWGRFVFMFFTVYMVEYLIFAFLFWVQGACVINMDNKFSHALWMSARTASTLGFDEVRPNPDCAFLNFCVMTEVIFSSLVGFIMLGVVFARFSAPFKRAGSMRFSKTAVCHAHPSGHWCISMRVANLRKHQILQPSIRMVVTAIDSITPSNYLFEHLKVENGHKQETNLELGFPANVVHVIDKDSFLYQLSLLEMDTRMMEILLFVDGIDAMTSKYMSARLSYSSSDIELNRVHVPLVLEMRGKKLGLDFNEFDKTVPASTALADDLETRQNMGLDTGKAGADVEAAARGAAATEGPSWQLRHSTFRRLGERYGAHMFRPAQGATPGLPNNGIAGTATYAPPQQQPPAGSSDGKDGGDAAPWVQAADGKPAGGGEGLSVSASAGAPPYAWGGPASAWGAPPGGAALPGAAGPSGDSPSLDGLVSAGAGASGIPLPVSSPAGAALDDSMAAEAAARRSSGRRSHDGAFHVVLND